MGDIVARCEKCGSDRLKPEQPVTDDSDVYCESCGIFIGKNGAIREALEAEGQRIIDDTLKGFGKDWK